MLDEIIRIFKEKDDFISGEEMSRRLGITRAAVWKKIRSLREKGYKIQAAAARGYKLIKSPEFSVEELRTLVRREIGKEISFFETVDSTNTLAMRLAGSGALHGTVIIADHQTKGKGRLGRTWLSPPKSNIYMSIILEPKIAPKDATLLTIMAATACASAIRNTTGLEVKIKWPNDLMVGDKKLGGILTEIKSDPDRITLAVIGIGINVNIALKDFPLDVRSVASSIKEALGKTQSRTIIIAGILKEIERLYGILAGGGGKLLLAEWKQLSSTLGRKVTVTEGKDTFTGIAEDIDDAGRLKLKLSSGAMKAISAGDVTMLR